jgi:hypothetical protein
MIGRKDMKKAFLFFIICNSLTLIILAQGESDVVLQRSIEAAKTEPLPNDYKVYRNRPIKSVIPKELAEKLQISNDDKTAYQSYLKGSKLQIIKLWNNQCTDLGKVVDVEKDKDCLALSGYEAGSAYSFENRNYLLQSNPGIFAVARIYPNTTISLAKEHFRSLNLDLRERNTNVLLTQIMTDLGEISLTTIGKKAVEVKKLSEVQLFDQTGKTVWKAKQNDYDLKYSDNLPALINHSYLLRSVFLDSQSSFRPRLKETIYAFQLMKIEENIAVILWKKVDSKWV